MSESPPLDPSTRSGRLPRQDYAGDVGPTEPSTTPTYLDGDELDQTQFSSERGDIESMGHTESSRRFEQQRLAADSGRRLPFTPGPAAVDEQDLGKSSYMMRDESFEGRISRSGGVSPAPSGSGARLRQSLAAAGLSPATETMQAPSGLGASSAGIDVESRAMGGTPLANREQLPGRHALAQSYYTPARRGLRSPPVGSGALLSSNSSSSRHGSPYLRSSAVQASATRETLRQTAPLIREKISRLESENRRLERELRASREAAGEQRQRHEDRIRQVREEHRRDVDREVGSARAEAESHRAAAQRARDEVSQLRAAAKRDRDASVAAEQARGAGAARYEAELRSAKARADKAESDAAIAREQAKRAREKATYSVEELRALQREAEALREQAGERVRLASEQAADARAAASAEVETARREAELEGEDARRREEALRSEMAGLRGRVEAQEQEVRALQADGYRLETALEEARARASKAENARRQAEHSDRESQDAQARRLRTAQQELAAARARITALQREASGASKERDSLQAKCRRLDAMEQDAQGTAEALANGLERVVAAFVAASEREEEGATAHDRWMQSTGGLGDSGAGARPGPVAARGRAAAELRARAGAGLRAGDSGAGTGRLREALAAVERGEEPGEFEDEDRTGDEEPYSAGAAVGRALSMFRDLCPELERHLHQRPLLLEMVEEQGAELEECRRALKELQDRIKGLGASTVGGRSGIGGGVGSSESQSESESGGGGRTEGGTDLMPLGKLTVGSAARGADSPSTPLGSAHSRVALALATSGRKPGNKGGSRLGSFVEGQSSGSGFGKAGAPGGSARKLRAPLASVSRGGSPPSRGSFADDAVRDVETADLRGQVEALEVRLIDSELQLTRAKAYAAEAMDELEEARAKAARADDSRADAEALRRRAEEAELALREVSDDARRADAEAIRARTEAAEARSRASAAEERAEQLLEEGEHSLRKSQGQLQDAEQRASSLREQGEELQRMQQDLRKKLLDVERERSRAVGEKTQLREQAKRIRALHDKLAGTCRRLTGERDDLAMQCTELEQQLRESNLRCGELESELRYGASESQRFLGLVEEEQQRSARARKDARRAREQAETAEAKLAVVRAREQERYARRQLKLKRSAAATTGRDERDDEIEIAVEFDRSPSKSGSSRGPRVRVTTTQLDDGAAAAGDGKESEHRNGAGASRRGRRSRRRSSVVEVITGGASKRGGSSSDVRVLGDPDAEVYVDGEKVSTGRRSAAAGSSSSRRLQETAPPSLVDTQSARRSRFATGRGYIWGYGYGYGRIRGSAGGAHVAGSQVDPSFVGIDDGDISGVGVGGAGGTWEEEGVSMKETDRRDYGQPLRSQDLHYALRLLDFLMVIFC